MKTRMLDFDAFMAEKKKEPIIVRIFGEEYQVKPEIPAIVPVMMARANEEMSDQETSRLVLQAGDILFGKENIMKLCEKGIGVEDLGTLIRQIFDMINGKGLDEDHDRACQKGKKVNLLHIWDAVEADFLRDYGIDLMEQLDQMSWRRFTVLFRNLSPYGASASRAEELRRHPQADDKISEEDGRKQAAAFFASILSTSK